MRCAKVQRWISRRIDGVLDERAEAIVAEHLSGCEACRAYAEGLTALGLESLDVPEPSPDFVVRVAREVGQTSHQRGSVLRRPRVFRSAAAGLGVAAAVGGFALGSLLHFANGNGTPSGKGTIEQVAGGAADPLAEGSVESVLIAMLPGPEE